MWFAFGMAALLLVLGLLVHAFKLHFLISGYNTMSRAKREKVDVRRVARAIGVWSYANAAVFTVVGLLLALEIAVPIDLACSENSSSRSRPFTRSPPRPARR